MSAVKLTDSMASLEKVQSLGLPGLHQPGLLCTWVLPLLAADWACLHYLQWASGHWEWKRGGRAHHCLLGHDGNTFGVKNKDTTSSGASKTIPGLQMSDMSDECLVLNRAMKTGTQCLQLPCEGLSLHFGVCPTHSASEGPLPCPILTALR